MTPRTAPKSLLHELDRAHIPYELVRHRHTESAAAEAAALGVTPDEVAKTVVLVAGDRFLLAVLPASRRVDLEKVRAFTGLEVEVASEDVLAGAYPEYELGAVPPFAPGDQVIVDVHVLAQDAILLDAGTHDQSLRIRPRDLASRADGLIFDISEE